MKSPCSFRLSGSIAMPEPRGLPRPLHVHRLALEEDLARVEVVGAEDRPRHLGAAGADEPREAHDLPGPHA